MPMKSIGAGVMTGPAGLGRSKVVQGVVFLLGCYLVAHLHVEVAVIEHPVARASSGSDVASFIVKDKEESLSRRTVATSTDRKLGLDDAAAAAAGENADEAEIEYYDDDGGGGGGDGTGPGRASPQCRFEVAYSRSDHGDDKVFKTVTVSGSKGDKFEFDFRCNVVSAEGKNCVNLYGAGVNSLTPVDDPDRIVAFGTCCTIGNAVLAQKELGCDAKATAAAPFRLSEVAGDETSRGGRATADTGPATSLTDAAAAAAAAVRGPRGDGAAAAQSPMTVHVLTCCRASSLERLLASLSGGLYDGDTVHLKIMIDLPRGQPAHNPAVVAAAEQFKSQWPHGSVTVVKQPRNMGLVGQWIESWQPDEATTGLGAMLEDDLELSKYWYRWAKRAHAAYGPGSASPQRDIVGYTLQRATLNASGGAGINGGPVGEVNYLYRLIGTWGLVLRPQPWRQFRGWYHTVRMDSTFKPYTAGASKLTGWYKTFEKEGTAEKRMWSIWMIKFCDLHDRYFLYTKCKDGRTLASNMQEAGLNFNKNGGMDFKRLEDDDPAIYTFPHPPQKLGWNGRPA